jgi:hypothetical protein
MIKNKAEYHSYLSEKKIGRRQMNIISNGGTGGGI